jgi:endonuclease G
MTNVIPQAPAVNQKAWNDLEIYCLHLVERGQLTLYIVAGPQGQGGTGTKGPADAIANGKVTVPAKCWKVIVVLDGNSGDDVGRIDKHTRVIAVIMPNEESVGHGWARFRTSIAQVETLTGYRFLDRVPAEVGDALRTKVDPQVIAPTRAHRGED